VVGTAASLLVLAAVLALVAWGKMPDLWVAGPAAVLVVVTGLVGIDEVGDTIDRLAPTLAFLAAVFVLAEVARDAGLFSAAGAWMGARASSSRRLVLVVSAVAIAVTVLMSLDATAVLFTPVVVKLVQARRSRSDAPLLATAQLANASSSLLPVSNLTNLLVFSATGLTFGGFAVRMARPTPKCVRSASTRSPGSSWPPSPHCWSRSSSGPRSASSRPGSRWSAPPSSEARRWERASPARPAS
jgi:arsenical pump membrane protein